MTLARMALIAAAAWMMLEGAAVAQQPAPMTVSPAAAPGMASPPQDPQALRLARAQRHLDRFDKDKNGFLTRSEYQRWYQTTARRRSALTWKRHAANMYKRLDSNKDSKLTIDEFVADPYFRRPRMGRSVSASQSQ